MIYDVVIIGAGAAGLMTSICARRQPMSVLLLEGQKKVGAKILMSGGTRCNVTNKAISENDYNSDEIMRVRNILRAFDNNQTIKFFQELGVELVLEPTGKYFPTTHSGKTVLDALLRKVEETGVELKTEQKVKAVTFKEGVFTIIGEDFRYQAKSVVVTTGGLSFPTTGSDGIGYLIAQSFGHSILKNFPALTPLTTEDKDWKNLSGISLETRLTLFVDGKKQIFYEGGFLFTHLGFSGPAVLDISRHFLMSEGEKELFVNLLPKYNQPAFDQYLAEQQQKHPRRAIKNVLLELLPERLVDVVLKKVAIDKDLNMNQLDKEARRQLVAGCVHYPLEVTGAVGYSKAEVTAGGLDLIELRAKTLESNLQPNLFFAGEIVDVDGRIGGFNFQWAWASGYAVGNAVARAYLERNQNE